MEPGPRTARLGEIGPPPPEPALPLDTAETAPRGGTAELVAKGPRRSCFKLRVRHGRRDIVARFNLSDRRGIYCGVAREGELGAAHLLM